MKKSFLFSILIILLSAFSLKAQSSVDQKLFESLHGHASMNVVFAVIAIILLGLFITLFRLDRKISRLEEKTNKRI